MTEGNNIVYFAETDARNKRVRFGIKLQDRLKHAYIIGKTGMGKTTLEENMAIQDIQSGRGVGIVDPHGEFAEKMLDYVPKERIQDVLYFNPSDINNPIGFNIMESVEDPDKRHLIADGLMGVFKKIWQDMWSARMEYILSNTVLALLEYPGATLLDINRMLAMKEYRKKVVENVTDPVVKAFWEEEFAKYTDRYAAEATPAIQNKVGQFTSNPLIRNVVGQKKSAFDIRKLMDGQKIFIMNLSKGKIGEENSNLIGAMLITKIYLAAMSRVDMPVEDRVPFYLYVDEFQNFATESFASILSEARKYGLSLTLAHQYVAQMDEKTRDAVIGNVGTHILFRVGAPDAEFFEKEFKPEFSVQDLVNLPFASIYLKLMIDGVTSRPFSATTLPPIGKPEQSFREEIIEFSRRIYSTPKEEIEKEVKEWTRPEEERSRKTQKQEQSDLYDAVCAVCGKPTKVPFKPEPSRPVFCKTHRRDDSKKTLPQERQAPQRRAMDLRSGELALRKESQEQKTASLSDLLSKKKAPKKSDIQGLKGILKEVLGSSDNNEKEEGFEDERAQEEAKNKKGTLKPGESIKFD